MTLLFERNRVARRVLSLCLCVVAVILGKLIAENASALDYRVPIIAVIAFVIITALAAGRRMWEPIFYFWILLFALGFRTYHLTLNLSIHPLDLVLGFLFLTLFLPYVIHHQFPSFDLPDIAWGFALFCIWGIVRGLQLGTPGDIILAELLPVVEVFLIFFVIKELVVVRGQWKRIGACLAIVCFYVTSLGIVEYYIPSAVAPLRAFFSQSIYTTTSEGVVRAAFSFWGSPVVAQVLVLLLPMLFAQFYWWKGNIQRLFLLVTISLTFVAVIISGYRSVWFLAIVVTLLYFILRRDWLWLILLAIGFSALTAILPPEVVTRTDNLLQMGFYADSSAYTRLTRIEDAWNLFLKEPLLGQGWGGSGWAHSDLLQIAANLGGIALFLFVLWFCSVFFRLVRVYLSSVDVWIWQESVALVTFLAAFAITLVIQASVVLPQMILPMWFLFALADRLSRVEDTTSDLLSQPSNG